jgi:peptidoglycan/LPS O-acetylase OafA/YrhL
MTTKKRAPVIRPGESRKRYDLQWLRALAALEVVLWHGDLVTKGFSAWKISASAYALFGGIGVELFFVISGFIMVRTVSRHRSAFDFLRARALRIYPLYWIFTSLAVLAYMINPAWRQGAGADDPVVVVLSYLNFPQAHYPILGPGWTLEHEAVFYMLIGLALLLFQGLGTATKIGFGVVVFMLGAIGVVIGVGGGAVPLVWTCDCASPYLIAFALGWFIGVAEPLAPRIRIASYLGMFGVLGLLVLLPEAVLVQALLLRIAIAVAVVALAFAGRRYLENDCLINRLMWRIGDASYSLYLSHIFILSAGGKLLAMIVPPGTMDGPARLLGLVAAVAFSLLCYAVLERPLLRLLSSSRVPLPTPARPTSPEGLSL